MSSPPLDAVRDAVHGTWDVPRVGFWSHAAEAAANDGDWAGATRRYLRLVDSMEDVEVGALAWRQLLVATLGAAVRSCDLELVEMTIAQLLGQALVDPSDVEVLRPIFSLADELTQSEIGAAIGAAVAQRVPTSPWGHFAAAHFNEQRRLRGGEVSARQLVLGFQRAATLFEDSSLPALRTHALLRAGVASIAFTNVVAFGRESLRSVARSVVPDDAHWLAYGLTFSPFWLDRVRAADWVLDVLNDEHMTAARDAVVVALLENLPTELTDLEVERLRAIASGLDTPPLAGLVAQQLDRREQLASHLATPFATYDGAIELPKVISAVLEVDADLLREGTSAKGNEDALRALAKFAARATPRQLAPLILVLARVERNGGSAGLESAAVQYARRAKPPSCGFLPLAHRAFVGGMPRAGAELTRRAIERNEDSPALQLCIARSIKWAAEAGSRSSLLNWLTIGEELLAT